MFDTLSIGHIFRRLGVWGLQAKVTLEFEVRGVG